MLSGVIESMSISAAVSVAADGLIFVTRFISPQEHCEVWVVLPDSFSLVHSGADRQHEQRTLACAAALFGKQVFYDAADKRMSEVGYMSCATCHIYGLSDGRVWDFTGGRSK